MAAYALFDRDPLSGLPRATLPVHAVEVTWNTRSDVYFWFKQSIDVLLSTFLLLWISPVLAAIAVLIALDSPGPVLFVQDRVGVRRTKRNNRVVWTVRTFRFYKFRSMITNADQSLHESYIRELRKGATNTRHFKLRNDPRITRFGRFLRASSLDELPQLVNVLKGDMSLVGPRPVPTYEAALYSDSHYERLSALPGITGLWQTKGRSRVPFEEMLRMDIEYARRANLFLDAEILLMTIPVVLSGRGAE
jgi:lipopolysaccharide/colanic/teichoic acid biosynthesis glycosyltransferase